MIETKKGVLKSLRAFQNPFFTGGKLPQAKPDGFASSLWEGASGAPGHLRIVPNTLAMGLTACALSVFASQIHLSQRERQEHCRKLSHYA